MAPVEAGLPLASGHWPAKWYAADIVLTVGVKDSTGLVRLRFDILPTADISRPIVESHFQLVRHSAMIVGVQYYFLVMKDWVRGWKISDGQPIFEQPTLELFAPYVRNDLSRLRAAGENFLAELTHSWIEDLGQLGLPRGTSPGEGELARSGALTFLRSATTATTDAL